MPSPLLYVSITTIVRLSYLQPERGNKMFITKSEGAVLSIFPITCYLAPYYYYVDGNEYTFKLMILFSVGVFFTFFRVLKEPEELMYLDAGTGGYWGEGWCLVPSLLPFLRNIGINFPWGLRNRRLEELEERRKNTDIHHYQDQREMGYRVNVQTTLFAANTNRLIESIIRWVTGYEKGKIELFYQRIGLRIMIPALILGWGANFFFPKTNQSNGSVQYSQLVEVNKGECVKIPDGVIVRIAVWSLPTKYPENISDDIVIESDDKLYKWTWSRAVREKIIFTKQQIIQTKTAKGDGKLCF